jgi:DinB family protein
MGAKGEGLAKQFEAKAAEATAVFERLSDADWKKVTASEKWSVGVTAHHIASSHALISGLIKTVADGKPGPNIAMEAIHAGNAKHAQEFAGCTKAETLALHKQGVAAAATILRGIGDTDFDRSANVLAGAPAMSAGQLAGGLLCGHIDEHLGSIKKTVGA